MARKGNQLKNGLPHRSTSHKKPDVDRSSSPLPSKDPDHLNVGVNEGRPTRSQSISSADALNDLGHIQDLKKNSKESRKSHRQQKVDFDETGAVDPSECDGYTEVAGDENVSNIGLGGDTSPNSDSMDSTDSCNSVHRGITGLENPEFPETRAFKFLRTAALSAARASADWVERNRPAFVSLKLNTFKALDHIRGKIQQSVPIVIQWITTIRNIMLLLFMVWLDCTVRGIDSFLRMGTTSFFSILWCCVLSVLAMVGISKLLMVLALAAVIWVFFGLVLMGLLSAIVGIIVLWCYGSFWTTGFFILLAGLAFVTAHDRIALLMMSAYSIYCAWSYVGWLGLVVALNLSFISSDVLLYFLRNIINEDGSPEQAPGNQGPSSFSPPNESENSAQSPGADRGPGVPSTSGSDSETTSDDEVIRLLNCSDHYAALGLTRFQNIDASLIRKEYRKKAMLVHPDKNMGNEKAAEAFKKLQNAYEVLLDSFKRKAYDDELRREELLGYIRKLHNAGHESKRSGFFGSGFGRSGGGAHDDDRGGESRRIMCKRCGLFHLWIHTDKQKSKARWCQECKDFHPAKDGDGWVEQSMQPVFFGMFQQVETPSAYVCAEGKVYKVTEWFICQGMRCHANTHKPSFQINTGLAAASRSGNARGSSANSGGGSRGGGGGEDAMTEDEFFEWLQNAMQNGMFENFAGSSRTAAATESGGGGFNNAKAAGGGGSGSGSGGGSGGGKRRKKGKKQW